MKIQLLAAIPLLVLSHLTSLAQTDKTQPAPLSISPSQAKQKALVAANYGKLPLSFEANQGQFDPQVKFLSRGSGYRLLLTDSAAILELSKPDPASQPRAAAKTTALTKAKSPAPKTDLIRMELPGAANGVQPLGDEQLPGKANYFVGNDSSKWHTNIPTYSRVKYTGVYPGVDLVYYGNQRQLEYDFIVAPGASPKPVKLHFAGASKLKLNADGDLEIVGSNGEIAFHKPVVYQQKDGRREPVDGRFTLLANNTVGFVLGSYDRSRAVVIDPVLSYSTYLGGVGYGPGVYAAVGAEGEVYLVDEPNYFPNVGLPTTYGAFSSADNRIEVIKLNPAGTAAVYIAAFGQNNGDYSNANDEAAALAVDAAGNVYIAGRTAPGDDFPTTPGAFQTGNHSGYYSTGFVTKLNPTGSDLVYSTCLGGSYEDSVNSIAVDAAGNAYVAGTTSSSDFPTTPGAFRTGVNNTSNTGFVAKLNAAGSALIYSTYLGGTSIYDEDEATGIAINQAGEAYISGITNSADFPITPGAYATTNKFSAPCATPSGGFVSKLNANGSGLIYSTYFSVGTMAADPAGNVYLVGYACNHASGLYAVPPTPGAFQSALGSQGSGYVTKLNPTGTGVVYSTYLSGSTNSDLWAIAVDAEGNAFVTGYTFDTDYPVTSDAFQATNKVQNTQDYADGIFTKINPAGSALIYSTYLGGTLGTTGESVALDSLDNAYISGYTSSIDFPVTSGASITAGDSFVSKFVFNGATTTTLTTDSKSAPAGTNVTFTAHVAAADGRFPNGVLEFHVDGTFEKYASLDGSENATYSTDTLTPEAHVIQAIYRGDPTHAASSGTLTETITGGQVATPNFSPVSGIYAGGAGYQAIYVTITSQTAGAVIHYTTDGTTPTASSPVYTAPIAIYSNATFKAIALASGKTASQVGTASYQLSTTESHTRTTLTSSAIALTSGEPVTFTATVTTTDGTIATGTVTFLHGNVPIGTVPLKEGVASLTTSALVNTGTYSITAEYTGSSTEAGGQSPVVFVKVRQ